MRQEEKKPTPWEMKDPKPPVVRWRSHANLLYQNWLNYFVYQNTPYDLAKIEEIKAHFGGDLRIRKLSDAEFDKASKISNKKMDRVRKCKNIS